MNYVADQVVAEIEKKIKRTHKDSNVKKHVIKNNLWVFVNSLIENPSFDSQTKDSLTTKPSKFGSKCELPNSFMKKVLDSGVVETIMTIANAKDKAKLKRMAGGKKKRVVGIPKLDDANWAGKDRSD